MINSMQSNHQTFYVGDRVKVISEAVKGWDRNPMHTIYAFGIQDDKTKFACLRADIPVVGDIEAGRRTGAYMTGVFYSGDFE